MRVHSALTPAGATIKLTASLARIFHGDNWHTVQRGDIAEALATFRSPLDSGLNRFLDRHGVEFRPSRVDIALDLYDVPYSRAIIWAVFAADVRFGRPPGFIYRGLADDTYYMKDWRDGRNAGRRWLSALVYGKPNPMSGEERHIRIEVRFFDQALAYYLEGRQREMPAADQIARMFPIAHRVIARMVRHVAPVSDRRAAALLNSLPERELEEIRDPMFFGREVTIRDAFDLLALSDQEQRRTLQLMHLHAIGVGDPDAPELRLFADVCQAAF